MDRRVVVTGLGIVTPISSQIEDCWRRLLAGESGIHPVRIVDVSDFKVRIGGDVYDWSPSSAYFDSKDLKRLDRYVQFALVAATDAVNDSGIDFSRYDPYRCGVVYGSGIGGLGTLEEQNLRLIHKGPDRVSPMTIPRLMLNAAGGNISIKYGLRGPNYAVATACASATNGMGDALNLIRRGVADVMVTGGTEACMTRMSIAAFQNMRALSQRNDEPTKASRPFDADRDGFVFSEGAGFLVFEEYQNARSRGAKIYAEVLGYGTCADAYHITQPDEQGVGAARAMEMALADAGIAPQSIDYINAHGTGTPLGDAAETVAIKKVFGSHAYSLSISSTKGQLGHSLGASGGVEMVLTVLALTKNCAPPTINLDTPDPQCDLDYTPWQPRQRNIDYAMNNSFGFGGHNACLVVGRYNE